MLGYIARLDFTRTFVSNLYVTLPSWRNQFLVALLSKSEGLQTPESGGCTLRAVDLLALCLAGSSTPSLPVFPAANPSLTSPLSSVSKVHLIDNWVAEIWHATSSL